MAKANPETIVLKGADVGIIQNEGSAAGVITPGMLVAVGAAGVAANANAAGAAEEKAFALELDTLGRGIDDNYAATEMVRYAICQPGVELYAWLDDGETVVVGSALESAGNGGLQVRTTGQAIAFAQEALTASGLTRCTVRVA